MSLFFPQVICIRPLVCLFCRDLDQYEIDLDQLFNQDLELNYTIAFNMTSELVALEILNRAFITLFEVRS